MVCYFEKNPTCVMKGIPQAPFVSNNNYWGVTRTAALNGPSHTHTHTHNQPVDTASSQSILSQFLHTHWWCVTYLLFRFYNVLGEKLHPGLWWDGCRVDPSRSTSSTDLPRVFHEEGERSPTALWGTLQCVCSRRIKHNDPPFVSFSLKEKHPKRT